MEKLIHFSAERAQEKAGHYFEKMLGSSKYIVPSLEEKAEQKQIEQKVLATMKLRAIIKKHESILWKQESFLIEKECFPIPPLKQRDRQAVIGVYSYILTAGEHLFKTENMLESLYKDMWLTAYLSAGRDLLQAEIASIEENNKKENRKRAELRILEKELYISSSFGPGFYGMEVEAVCKFSSLLSGQKIGVKVLDTGFLSPEKSCVGFYLLTTQENILPKKDCTHCKGNGAGCAFCV